MGMTRRFPRMMRSASGVNESSCFSNSYVRSSAMLISGCRLLVLSEFQELFCKSSISFWHVGSSCVALRIALTSSATGTAWFTTKRTCSLDKFGCLLSGRVFNRCLDK